MANGGISTLLDISRRSLSLNTQALRIIGNNIANVNTPGYSRRKAEIQEAEANGIEPNSYGIGAQIDNVVRVVDQYLNKQELSRINDRAKADIAKELLTRAEALFSVDQTTGRIGGELSEFFSALQDLTSNPADLGLRSNVLEHGASLTAAIRDTFGTIAALQKEADDRIGLQVEDINRLTAQIAQTNAEIAASEVSNQENLTLRDKRDQLLRELAEKISIEQVDNSDGTVTVTLENGFGLVIGKNSRALEFSHTPSFDLSGSPALGGGQLGYIVYDFDQTNAQSHVDLTSILAGGGGEIAGLLNVRGMPNAGGTTAFDATGDLIELGSRVEAIARDLLVRFNTAYLGPVDETPGGNFDPSSGDLQGDAPGVFGLFSFVGATDAVANGLPGQNDLTAMNLPSYAAVIDFNVDDPADLAGAVDLNATSGTRTFAPGDSRNIQALLDLRDDAVNYSTYSVGTFSTTATIEQLYEETVSRAGSLSSQATHRSEVATDLETQTKELIASTSGVSLDEEFAQLINYQRAFQASAKMVRVGDELLNEIINLLR